METANTAKKKPTKRHAKKPAPVVPLVLLDMDQAASALGVSTPIAYLLANEGILKTFLIGRLRRCTPRAVQDAGDKLEAQGGALPMDSGGNNGNSPVAAASP